MKKIRGEKYTKVGDVAVCRERDRVCFSFFSAFEKNEKNLREKKQMLMLLCAEREAAKRKTIQANLAT